MSVVVVVVWGKKKGRGELSGEVLSVVYGKRKKKRNPSQRWFYAV